MNQTFIQGGKLILAAALAAVVIAVVIIGMTALYIHLWEAIAAGVLATIPKAIP